MDSAENNTASASIETGNSNEGSIHSQETPLKINDESVCKTKLESLAKCATWEQFCQISGHVLPQLLPVTSTQCATQLCKRLLDADPRYERYIPEEDGKRDALLVPADGSCFFHTISVLLYGSTSHSNMLRLAAVCHGAAIRPELEKLVCQMGSTAKKLTQWVDTADQTNVGREVEKEIAKASQPSRDIGTLMILVMADWLRRPIIQHTSSDEEMLKGGLFPFTAGTMSASPPLHILWVPSRPRAKSRYVGYTHVVPFVPSKKSLFDGHSQEECGLRLVSACAFMHGLNPTAKLNWIMCDACEQWFHTDCLRTVQQDVISCGCDHLLQKKMDVQLKKRLMYSDREEMKKALQESNLKDVVETVKAIPNMRYYVHTHDGFITFRQMLHRRKYGSVINETILSDITSCLTEVVDEDQLHLIPTVFIPDVIIEVIQKTEKISRFLTEIVMATDSVLREDERW